MRIIIVIGLLLMPGMLFAQVTGWSEVLLRALVSGETPTGSVYTTPTDEGLLGINSDAKEYLATKRTSDSVNVRELNTEFAERLTRFIRAGEAAGHSILIFSGYRSPEHQKRILRSRGCCANADCTKSACPSRIASPGGIVGGKCTGSRHQCGIAADLKYNGSSGCNNNACKWAHANAKSFGLHYRLANEPWHIEPTGAPVLGGSDTPEEAGLATPVSASPNSTSMSERPDSESIQEQTESNIIDEHNAAAEQQAAASPKGSTSDDQSGIGESNYNSGENPYSHPTAGDSNTLSNNTVTSAATMSASLTCTPSSIAKGDKSLIEWSCPSGSTSRGGTSRPGAGFNTRGYAEGKGYASPSVTTIYKLVCVKGGVAVGEDTCTITTRAQSAVHSDDSGIIKITITPKDSTVPYGGATSVDWETSGTTACRVRYEGKYFYGVGPLETGPLIHDTTYVLECITREGLKSDKTTVQVK